MKKQKNERKKEKGRKMKIHPDPFHIGWKRWSAPGTAWAPLGSAPGTAWAPLERPGNAWGRLEAPWRAVERVRPPS